MILSASASVIPFTFIRSSLEAELMSVLAACVADLVLVDLVLVDFAVDFVVVVVLAGAAAGVEAGGVDGVVPFCAIATNGTLRAAATAREDSRVERFIVFLLRRQQVTRDAAPPRRRSRETG
jgi:hypothetical protein